MMLHRHFEAERADKNMTTSAVLNRDADEFVSEVFPPEQEQSEQPKRGRKKKTETD